MTDLEGGGWIDYWEVVFAGRWADLAGDVVVDCCVGWWSFSHGFIGAGCFQFVLLLCFMATIVRVRSIAAETNYDR